MVVLYRQFLFTFYYFLCLLFLLAMPSTVITLLPPEEHALAFPPVTSTETKHPPFQ